MSTISFSLLLNVCSSFFAKEPVSYPFSFLAFITFRAYWVHICLHDYFLWVNSSFLRRWLKFPSDTTSEVSTFFSCKKTFWMDLYEDDALQSHVKQGLPSSCSCMALLGGIQLLFWRKKCWRQPSLTFFLCVSAERLLVGTSDRRSDFTFWRF